MKCLIISYNPLSDSINGGKRLISLFSSFNPNQIMQLFVRPCEPDYDKCCSFYRITERDILNNFNLFSRKSGELYKGIDVKGNSNSEEKRSKYKSNILFKICREMIWKFGIKNYKSIYKWIEKEKPDCIFADTGDYNFLYNLEMKISKKYGLPIICGFGDDYYSLPYKNLKVLEKVKLFLLKKKIKQFICLSSKVITVCDSMSDFYAKEFKCETKTIPTGSTFNLEVYKKNSDSKKISYLGNLSLGRYKNLIEIAKKLNEINLELNSNYELYVYSRCFDEKIISEISNVPCLNYMGFIDGGKVKDVINDSFAVIHTESFEKDNILQVKYSMSTKIADNLACGIPFIAYGPSEVGSIKYLKENNCAFVIDENTNLYYELKKIILDFDYRNKYINRAIQIANINHNDNNNSKTLMNIMIECIKEK